MLSEEQFKYEQLRMFMTGEELIDSALPVEYDDMPDAGSWEDGHWYPGKDRDLDSFWKRKTTESMVPREAGTPGAGVHRGVREGSITEPVQVYHHRAFDSRASGADKRMLLPSEKRENDERWLMDGYHRAAAGRDHDRRLGGQTYLPVEYSGYDPINDKDDV